MAKVGNLKGGTADDNPHRFHPLMGQLEKLLEQADFPQYLERGWVYGVAAKIAEEVLVLFEHRYFDPLPCQQKADDHAGRTAAYDTAIGFHNSRGHFHGDPFPRIIIPLLP